MKKLSTNEANMQKNLRLKIQRIAAGLSQRELAEVIGSTEMAVCRWETGRARPSPEMRQRVADALRCKTFEIWDR